VQLLGALAIIAWTAIGTLAIMLLVGMTLGLRVSPEDEERGLDKSEHGVGGGKLQRRPSGLAQRMASSRTVTINPTPTPTRTLALTLTLTLTQTQTLILILILPLPLPLPLSPSACPPPGP
jgi:hypothetical protein